MTAHLLDVNMLLALLDPEHVQHDRVDEWFGANAHAGWATCPITENGYMRIAASRGYTNPFPVPVARTALAEASASAHHRFWSCDLSLLDDSIVDIRRLHGPRQVTDAYLLALAVAQKARFATLDRTIDLRAVRGASAEQLVVLR